MNALKAFALRYRDSRVVYCVLWAAIVLGIVPAIVAQNILPVDSFVLHFGIEIDQLNYLPGIVCLLLAGVGLIACILQKRFLFIPLLLPPARPQCIRH